MKKSKSAFLLSILIMFSATTGCEKDEVNEVEVALASWYFGTWNEDGTGETLTLSQSAITFSPSSSLQLYANNFTWYDAGDESADTFFGPNTAGAVLQATQGYNSVPDQCLINHDGVKLTISTLYTDELISTYTREATQPIGGGNFNGVWLRQDAPSYLKLSGSSAWLCNGGTEWTGTFSASEQKLVMTAQGQSAELYIEISGSTLIVYPGSWSNTHDAAVYDRITNYPC